MRDARGGGGPKPKPISGRRNYSPPPHKPRTISQQLAHYSRSQGHRQTGLITPEAAASLRRNQAAVQRVGRMKVPQKTVVQSLQEELSNIGLGGAAHPIRRLQHPGGRMEFPGFGKVPEERLPFGEVPKVEPSPREIAARAVQKAPAAYRKTKAARSEELQKRG